MKNKIIYILAFFCFHATTVSAINIEFIANVDIDTFTLYHLSNGKNSIIEKKNLRKGERVTINDSTLKGMFTIKYGDKTFYYYSKDDKKCSINILKDSLRVLKADRLNKKLYEWSLISNTARNMSINYQLCRKILSDYDHCFKVFDDLERSSICFLSDCKKLDKHDYEIIDLVVNADVYSFPVIYSFNPLSSSGIKVPKEFAKHIVNDDRFVNDKMLNVCPNIMSYMIHFVMFANKYAVLHYTATDYFKSDRIKAAFILETIASAQSYARFRSTIDRNIKYFVTDYEKNALAKLEERFSKLKPGEKGFNFKLSDVNGKMVNLSDFKGKLVYVDIWATWCGPCKKEIPHLQKLEKEMEGKDIVFISISVDKDIEKWKSYVNNEKLSGIQLIDKEMVMSKTYKFSGIPFFILYDNNGKVVETNFSRPSDPQTKIKIVDLLKKRPKRV